MNTPETEVLPSTVIREGESFIFICKGDGSEPVKYQIYKDKILIGSSNVFVVNNMTREKSGVYHCKTSNANNLMESKNTMVTVQCKFTEGVNLFPVPLELFILLDYS